MYNYRNTNHQQILLEQEKNTFTTADLAILWETKNKNNLYTTIHRYLKRHILYHLQRGLYSTLPPEKLNPFELGCAVAGPSSYISAETILQKDGIIMQNIEKITLFGHKKKEFTIADQAYLCRYLNPKYLLNRQEIAEKNTYSIATTDRAIADLLHLNPHYYFDNQLAIDDQKIRLLTAKIGYK